MRIQKLLSNYGICSRREAEKALLEKRIFINGKLAKIGDRVEADSHIKIDGKRVVLNKPKHKTLLFHKPVGYVCSHKGQNNQKSIYDLLPKKEKWISVGRLDLNSSGLLLISTDGDFVQKYSHPKSAIKRLYQVRVFGDLSDEQRQRLCKGVWEKGQKIQFFSIKKINKNKGKNQWFEVVLTSGKNREVRRGFEYFGLQVNKLVRYQFGDFTLPKTLKVGDFITLKQ